MEKSFFQKYQKWIWWLVLVPVLATFSITGTCGQMFGGGARSHGGEYASFELPSGKKVSLTDSEFRDFAATLRGLGAGRELDREDVLSFAMLYHAAVDAGIYVPDSQISQMIKMRFQNGQQYEMFLKQVESDSRSFEGHLRRALTVGAYRGGLNELASLPDGEAIVKKWQENNEEYKLEYVSFSAADAKSSIDKKKISDADLKAFYDAMAEGAKNAKYHREPKMAIEGATFKLSSEKDAKLLPLIEGVTIDDKDLELYYNQNKTERFKLSEPKDGENYLRFEAAKERVTRELKLKLALEKLVLKAKEEFAKGNFSWKDFGKPYGLEPFEVSEPKTKVEFRTLDRFGSVIFAERQLFPLSEGEFSMIPGLATNDFFIYRVTKKIPEGLSDFEEVREKVLDEYLEKKSFETAKEQAEAFLKDAKPATTEPAKEGESKEDLFAKASKTHDVKIQTVDFFSKSYGRTMEAYRDAESVGKFLKRYYGIFSLKAGEISAAIEDQINKAVHVVRVVERRLPDAASITPKGFEETKMYGGAASQDLFSFEHLKTAFNLKMNQGAAD